METLYVKSTSPRIALYGDNGRIIRFESVDGVTGWAEVADVPGIATVNNAIAKKVGGRVEIVTKAAYDDWKKKSQLAPPIRYQREEVQTGQQQALDTSKRLVAPRETIPVPHVNPAGEPTRHGIKTPVKTLRSDTPNIKPRSGRPRRPA